MLDPRPPRPEPEGTEQRRRWSAWAYTVYFPLTRVTNVNNIQAVTAAGGNVLAAGYKNQPSDCQYGPATGQVAAQSVDPESST